MIDHETEPALMLERLDQTRLLTVEGPFSLAATCGPVAWSRGRWPHRDWQDGQLIWVGWSGDWVVWRAVRQTAPQQLAIAGTAPVEDDANWAASMLGIADVCPGLADPRIEALRTTMPGLRSLRDGSLFLGLVTSIVGQSISVAAAAVTEAKLAALFALPVRLGTRDYWPLPRADQLADADAALIRQSGVTWRRAEALVAAGKAMLGGAVPTESEAMSKPDEARRRLRALPLVGPWTAESALLWGIGLPDAHPSGDVALLRAAQSFYQDDTLDLRGLDRLAETWQPNRGWAARLLWANRFGPAPADAR